MTMTTVSSLRYMIYLQYPPQKGICSFPKMASAAYIALKAPPHVVSTSSKQHNRLLAAAILLKHSLPGHCLEYFNDIP